MEYKIRKAQSDKYICGVCDKKIHSGTRLLITGYSKNSNYEHANTAKIHLHCAGIMINKLTKVIQEKNILFDNYRNEI